MSNPQAARQSETHAAVDTDASTSAIHHTLGTSAYQAAAGNHTHGSGQYRQFVYEVSGGDFTFVIDEDGNPVMALEDLE